MKVLITGAPRSGTSLLTILVSYFRDLKINPTIETPSTLFEQVDVFKTPQRVDGLIWNDFIQPKHSMVDFINKGVKLVVMLRDGRDVLVSKHNADGRKSYWCPPERWINSILELIKTMEYVEQNNLQDYLHVIRYENLTLNLEGEIKRLEEFLGLSIDPNYKTFHQEHTKINQITHALNGIRPVEYNSNGWKQPEHEERIKSLFEGPYKDILTHLLTATGYIEES